MAQQYIRVERSLLRHGRDVGLSLDGAWLYSLLRDRCTLSAKNGLADAKGRIYVYCSRESAAELIGCSIRKAVSLFSELAAAGLIREEKAGSGRRIYIRQWCEPSVFHPAVKLMNGGWWDVTLDRVDIMPDDYITVDTAIAGGGLSTRAKILYAALSDESSEQEMYGRDMCSIPREEAMELLNCTRNTLCAVYKELEAVCLISRSARQGYGKQRAVAVTEPSGPIFASQSPKICMSVAQNLHLQSPKICTQTNLSDLSVIIQPFEASLCSPAPAGAQEAPQKENRIICDMDAVAADMDKLYAEAIDRDTAQAAVSAIASLVAADLLSPTKAYTIGSEREVSKDALLAAYNSINRYTMDTLVSKLVDNWDRIKDHNRYIRAALYHADKHEAEAYYMESRLTAV